MRELEAVAAVAKTYGVDKKQQKELLSNLPDIISEREAFEIQYQKVITMDIEDPETWKKARVLRMRIRDNRTKGINVWHRTSKDYFLKGGQFVDAIKRKEIAVNERMEKALEEIEKHEEIQKQKKIEELKETRSKEFQPYWNFLPKFANLGEMEEDEYQKLLTGAKLQFEAEQERLRKEEEERLEKLRIEKLHNERRDLLLDVWQFVKQKDQNFGEINQEDFDTLHADLEAEKADYEKEQERIRKENERLEAERKKALAAQKAAQQKAEREREVAEEKARKEREALEAKMRKEKAEADKKLAAELEARKKAEKEFWEAQKKIKEAEERKKKEEEERKEAERQKQLAPDKDKLLDIAQRLKDFDLPEIKSKDAKIIREGVDKLLQKVINYIETKTKSL